MTLHRFFAAAFVSLALSACAQNPDDGPYADPDEIDGRADSYRPTGVSCSGWPRVALGTADFVCAGLVATSDVATFKPRALLELPGRPNEFLVTDLGNWSAGTGKLWYLDAREAPRSVFRPVLTGLALPHHIALGPEGYIYVGEDRRIFAFAPDSVGADGSIPSASIFTVLSDLPPTSRDGRANSLHPLTQFVFDDDGNLYVNVGAYSDHCEGYAGRECHEADRILNGGNGSSTSRDWGAVIRRYDFRGTVASGYDPAYRVVAYGLRNSMGLVFAPNGDLLQVENSRDFPESDRPFEELNVIPRAELDGTEPAHHYGWPYCYDVYGTSDEWAGYAAFRCDSTNTRYRPPHILLPPHGAPLGLTYYRGSMFSELQDKLIVPLHGYRVAGHRVLAYDVDDNGLPVRSAGATYLEDPTGAGRSVERAYPNVEGGPFTARGTYLVDSWYAVADVRPKGAPVAPYVAADGRIWIADDKNRAIFVLSRAESALPPIDRVDLYPAYRRALNEDAELRALYETMVTDVLHSPQCTGCHDDFRLLNDDSQYPELRYLTALGGWIAPGDLQNSVLFTKLNPVGSASMPPPDRAWSSAAQGTAAVAAVEDFILALPAVTPAFNEGFIGGPCTADDDCDYDGGICVRPSSGPSFCSLPCTTAAPFCPDRAGNASTFCVDLGGGQGRCVAQCAAASPECLDGQMCVSATRLGRTTTRTVCR